MTEYSKDFFEKLAPLCVDLDGTLIHEDVIWVSWKQLLHKNKFVYLLKPLFWLFKGRAYFKKRLFEESSLNPQALTYHQELIAFLKEYKKHSLKLVLATAADKGFADIIAKELGFFDEIIASNGIDNLRAEYKAKALCERYGEKGFSYAGNSYDDLKVWEKSRYAIGVRLSDIVKKQKKHQKNFFIKEFQ